MTDPKMKGCVCVLRSLLLLLLLLHNLNINFCKSLWKNFIGRNYIVCSALKYIVVCLQIADCLGIVLGDCDNGSDGSSIGGGDCTYSMRLDCNKM